MQMETQMRREVLEIPDAVERLLTNGMGEIDAAADMLHKADPQFLATVARGSSDHVATYLKYASELLLGVPVASIGPSIASIYNAPPKITRGGVHHDLAVGSKPRHRGDGRCGDQTGGADISADQ